MKEAMQSIWIGIWSLIEGGGDGLKMKKWEKLQGRVGKACFSISHDHAKWNRIDLVVADKGNVKSGFAWPCEIFAQSWEKLQQDENNADRSSTSHHRAKLLGLTRKCIFSIFLDEEVSERPLRWCQVSTWPWPINRKGIDSFKNFLIFFLIIELSKFLLSI